eukprot:10295007-Alexandrium_andersonii.AAC.1
MSGPRQRRRRGARCWATSRRPSCEGGGARIARTAEPSRRGTCGGWCPMTPAARPPSVRRSSVILNEDG